jgi:hypothetical protein
VKEVSRYFKCRSEKAVSVSIYMSVQKYVLKTGSSKNEIPKWLNAEHGMGTQASKTVPDFRALVASKEVEMLHCVSTI